LQKSQISNGNCVCGNLNWQLAIHPYKYEASLYK